MFDTNIGPIPGGEAFAKVDPTLIQELVAQLDSEDGAVRQRARRRLVEIGAPAVMSLTAIVPGSNERLDWEAIKALDQIGDPRAAAAFVHALEDPRGGISWLAAEGLIRLGHYAVKPLLEALAHGCDSTWLRRGGHHVLRELIGCSPHEVLLPVLRALEDVEPQLTVCAAAGRALLTLSQYTPPEHGSRVQG